MKKFYSKEVVIGFCVIVALCILFFGINFLKGKKIFGSSNYYYATFTNVAGLSEAAAVNLNGFKVGTVEDIRYDYEHPGNVIVELSLDNALRLPEGTTATLTSDLLGTGAIRLSLGTGTEMLSVGATLPSAIEGGLMDSLSETLMPEISGIMPKIDSLLVNVNTLVTSSHLQASLANLETITTDLSRLSDQLAKVSTSLPPLLAKVNVIADNATGITSDVNVLTTELKDLPLDSLMQNLLTTSENLHALTRQLNDPQSSIGQLMNNPELYNNLNHTVTSLDSLFIDIKKNPKRYVTIKVF